MRKTKKLSIDIELAVEERAEMLIGEVINKHWHAAQNELNEKMNELSERLKEEVSWAAKEALREKFVGKKPEKPTRTKSRRTKTGKMLILCKEVKIPKQELYRDAQGRFTRKTR